MRRVWPNWSFNRSANGRLTLRSHNQAFVCRLPLRANVIKTSFCIAWLQQINLLWTQFCQLRLHFFRHLCQCLRTSNPVG